MSENLLQRALDVLFRHRAEMQITNYTISVNKETRRQALYISRLLRAAVAVEQDGKSSPDLADKSPYGIYAFILLHVYAEHDLQRAET